MKLLKRMAQVNKREIPQHVVEKLEHTPSAEEEKKQDVSDKENFLDLLKTWRLVLRIFIVSVGW